MSLTVRDFSSYRKSDLRAGTERGGYWPLDVAVVGVTGAGKSTTLSALFGYEVARIGHGPDPETLTLQELELVPKLLRLWDTPGFGDGVAADARHAELLKHLMVLPYSEAFPQFGFVDLVLVILDASPRDLGTTYHLLNEVVLPHIDAERVLVAINQADMVLKGKGWNHKEAQPTPELEEALTQKARSLQDRVRASTGVDIAPVCYSAAQRYNLEGVVDLIIEHMPRERRRLI